MTKRIVFIVLGLVFLLGLVANAEYVPVKKELWEKIPEERKFNLTTHNVLGDKELQVAGFYFNFAKDIVKESLIKFANEKFQDRDVLLVLVDAYTAKGFFPGKLTFIQGNYRYNPSVWFTANPDYAGLGGPFSGTVKPGSTIQGFIGLPKEIDRDKSFEVWYDGESTSMGG